MSETAGYMRFFPYDQPYENQREAMDRIHNSLTRGQDVLFEGACGTGKTLSSLVPALEVAREQDKTVVITTNVHQQMRQFVAEARAITREEDIRAIVFKGKSSMCHIDVGYEECQALRDNTRAVVDAERDKRQLERRQRELLEESQGGDGGAADARSAVMDELESIEERLEDLEEQNVCDYYRNNLTQDTDDFFAWLFEDVRTPEEIYEYAEREGFCGYELLKEGIEGVDLVVCNYHHLLDSMIREQFFRWLGRDPEDVIAVFDEAHNVEDAAREHATRTCSERTFDSALDELADADDPRSEDAANVLSAFHRALVETYEDSFGFGERERIDENWEDISIANEDRKDDLTLEFLQRYSGRGIEDDLEAAMKLGQELDEQYEEAYREGETATRTECQTLQAAAFVSAWMNEGSKEGLYPVVSVTRDAGTDEIYGRAELYTCLPRQVTGRLFEEVYGTILMSATLQPFDVTEDVLGLEDPVTMAYGLQFPAEHRRTYAVETPPLFSSDRDDPAVQEEVAETIHDAVRMTPGNTLAFFPNYGEAERYAKRLEGRTEKTVYLDEPGTSVEELRQQFVADDGAVLCTSLWGTLAEGVSFDGDDAHTVLVVGVPYPHLDDRAEAVQEAYDAAFDGTETGWRYAVEIPTVRKTRQALGRVIRSPEDVGVRALLDRRYSRSAKSDLGRYSVNGTFPHEEREELIDIDPEKLKFSMLNFYGDHDAYDGETPAP
ncbi:DEAD_2 domain protein [Haloterrigena turkmenica DSM 5511]|uniref:DEAD_2 domain protein n=1 Tax=Haloterrigena turkmenica (strain ATCC 51198 / DSM 5511 / JCM 9101 / NCIMB 13204 / VKM B-1734 / 4k) TaxID=543526 RepID=D2RUU3_HALTV|nr:ATP-dependent DNA helicase [Haloterrigena turkmenica]ADB59236.1 DEAD_2 domain protein [Haloterrigena turkmenica DSM 5511]